MGAASFAHTSFDAITDDCSADRTRNGESEARRASRAGETEGRKKRTGNPEAVIVYAAEIRGTERLAQGFRRARRVRFSRH